MNTDPFNWRRFFPLEAPRPDQIKAIDWICSQLTAGHRRIILEAGTGVGKSAIAVTVARWLQDREAHLPIECSPGATILTSQKTLQDQYSNDFSHAQDLRAAANFTCNGPVGGTCGETSRVRKVINQNSEEGKGISRCHQCPYREAKDAFVTSHLGVTNYSYSLSESVYAGELPIRRLLVLDEAHNVEDEVRRWTAVEVSDAEAADLGLDLPSQGDGINPTKWLMDDVREAVRKQLAVVGLKIRKKVDAGQVRSLKTLAEENDALDKRLCQLNRLEEKGGKLLVSFHDNPAKHTRSIRYQPTDVSQLIEETLYSRATAVLLMSATLLDRDVFSASVGLKGAPYLSIPTSFKSSAFGLTLKPIGRMTRRYIDTSIKDLPKAIRSILRANPNHKGIIHTTNYRITRALEEALVGTEKRLLFQRSAEDRAMILDRHISSKEPTVIVSPSMIEGLDLRDDLSRFQVICKVPYPDTSDPLVAEKSSDWYDWRTIRTLVQSIGRSVRSHDDWSKTYVLDLSFIDLMERASYMFPQHLKDGIIVEDINQ